MTPSPYKPPKKEYGHERNTNKSITIVSDIGLMEEYACFDNITNEEDPFNTKVNSKARKPAFSLKQERPLKFKELFG